MKRVGILVVAYNASSTLPAVLDRIPADVRARVSDVLVCDDHSDDATYLVGLGYRQVRTDLPLTVVRHARNLGYGGNQKAGYQWAIDHGLDIVVLLHGDGQYAPEYMPDILSPLERGEADAVFGSRMIESHAARRGGMPLYKYVGNRVLTRTQNALVGLHLSEWHSGYRAYSVAALRDIPLMANSDDFDFDTEIIIQLHEAGKRIVEVPIPTYYGDEICHVNGLRYARDVIVDSTRYRLHKAGLGSGELAFASEFYDLKHSDETSHGRLLAWLRRRPPSRVLDLGCSDGRLGEQVRELGHEVVGVDVARFDDVAGRLDGFVHGDLDSGIPPEVGGGYDVVLAADVLEHVRHPERVLHDARRCLRAGGSVMASVPNFAHWYPRVRVATGTFDYDRRGILDRDHVRFFTRRSFERLVAASGYVVRRRDNVGAPTEVVERGGTGSAATTSALDRAQAIAVHARPSLFAYQFLYELDPVPGRTERAGAVVDVEDWDRRAGAPPDAAIDVPTGSRRGGALVDSGSFR
jgi:glycosyltransferase involved in cell wall biosynthesis